MIDGRGTTVTNEEAPPENSGPRGLANRTSAAMRAALGQTPSRRPMPFPTQPEPEVKREAEVPVAGEAELSAAAEAPEAVAEVAPEAGPEAKRAHGGRHGRRRSGVLAVVAWTLIGLLVAALVSVNVLLRMSNSDTTSTDRAGQAAISAATTRIPVILSYSYKTLDSDIATALSNVTGSFKNDYQSLLQSAVAPVATQKQITTKATVVGAGLVVAHRNSAIVLVFVNQSTTSTASKTPQLDGSRIRVGLTKVHGLWLVSSLSPV